MIRPIYFILFERLGFSMESPIIDSNFWAQIWLGILKGGPSHHQLIDQWPEPYSRSEVQANLNTHNGYKH